MNLIEESFQNKEEKKKKRTTKIVLAAIIVVLLIIIGIVGYLMYLQSTVMRLFIDGQKNEKLKNILVFEEDGTIYAPIKEIASYLGYESYNGEYSEKSEQQSKCYVQSENEVANFELGENKIYKLDLSQKDGDYEYVYLKKPVKAINGVLYVTTEGLEKAFNISFDYQQEKNRITIFTLPYLYQFYANQVLDYGYAELSNEFVNQKAILNDQLIVEKVKGQFGVINTEGTAILEAKYDNITYLPNTGDFLVENNKKVGIMSANRETKVQIIYDSIELMDSDSGLYVVKRDNRYGVIDIRGNIKIYIENDEIGMDISKFAQNNIKSKYILAGNLIPVRQDKLWALYDKSGNQVTEYKYDRFGYIASNNREALNLLVIPNYNVLVALKEEKYTLINSSGAEIIATVADDIYMTIAGGEKHYYITVNDQRIDAEEWMDVNAPSIHTDYTNNETRNNTNNQGQQDGNGNHQENQQGQQNGNGNNQGNQQQNSEGNDDQEQNNNGEEQENNNDNGEEQPVDSGNGEEQQDNSGFEGENQESEEGI